ncbi:MAG: hypothetical protein IPQ07_27330 [Myxococcales bacterium]|nr:hypothetical protein [Myxococcales bacterium]
MRLLALAALAACSSDKPPEPAPAVRSAVTLPAAAFEIHVTDEFAGLRDSRTITTFCLPRADRAQLAKLPCTPVATVDGRAACVWRKLHTEVAIESVDRGSELFVTVIESEYDNCLFEGCPKPP